MKKKKKEILSKGSTHKAINALILENQIYLISLSFDVAHFISFLMFALRT